MIYTLVPLGNPGEKYANTRHNAARIVLDLGVGAEKLHTLMREGLVETFLMVDTYMNESGKPVAEYLKYHEGRELIIIYDDKDLPLGKIRISHDRGDGGHNGVKSIIESLGTKEFIRIRVGIAPENVDGNEIKAPHGEEVQGFVMGKFTSTEKEVLEKVALKVVDSIEVIAREGYQKAMEKFN